MRKVHEHIKVKTLMVGLEAEIEVPLIPTIKKGPLAHDALTPVVLTLVILVLTLTDLLQVEIVQTTEVPLHDRTAPLREHLLEEVAQAAVGLQAEEVLADEDNSCILTYKP